MKKMIFFFALIASISSYAQDLRDSSITLQVPRVFGWYIAKNIVNGLNKNNYKMMDVLKPYVADSTKPDSLFAVKLKVSYVQDAIEVLLSGQCDMVFIDRLKIIHNQRVGATAAAIAGYTSLESQIVSKANGSSSEKDEATYIRDWYLGRRAAFEALWRENRDDVIKTVNQ